MEFNSKKVELLGDLILIEPTTEYNTLTQTIQVPDETKNTGKKSKASAIKATKEVEEEYKTAYQVAKVLKVGSGNAGIGIKEGDKIIYNMQSLKALDLFAKEHADKTCPQMITRFSVIGKVK